MHRVYALTAIWLSISPCYVLRAGEHAKVTPPKIMMWSWFAPDDFRPLAGRGAGAAYLALSIRLADQTTVTPSPRAVPVRIPANMYEMAVVRIDFDQAHKPAYTARQRELVARMVAEIAAIAHVKAVQIDFDAPQPAWRFYRQLLLDVRARLQPDVFLSMTALVSWCDNPESWLVGLPVDEIVPMAFYMGQSTPAVLTMLSHGGQFQFSGCRGSVGIQLPVGFGAPTVIDEPEVKPRKAQRAYFFMQAQWSPEALEKAEKAFLP